MSRTSIRYLLMGAALAVTTACPGPSTCNTNSDCGSGEVCSAGACVKPDAGSTAGGSAAGGSAAGGSAAGGSAAGGSAAGGSAAGGSAAGGSAAGGSAAGGSAGGDAGGSAAGGSAAGGSAAGGSAGGGAGGSAAANFMALRLGDGGVTLSSVATWVILEERAISDGSLLRTIDVSTLATAPGFGLSGTATSEGYLSLAGNGSFVVFAGYRAPLGTTGISATASATIPRCIARVDVAGNLDTSTIVTDAFSGSNFRGVATNDGMGYWAAGGNSGVRYIVHNSTGASAPVFVDSTNNRAVSVFDGQLYASTSGTTGLDGGTQIFSLGALPQSTAPLTSLPGVDVTSPNAFVLFDATPAVMGADTLYVADTASAANGGVRKYTYNGLTWSLAWRANTFVPAGGGANTTSACSHVAAASVAGDIVVLCTAGDSSANRIVKYVDVGGTSTTAPVGAVLVTAPVNTSYRGVATSPR
ncbi:MAG: hypothetical protein IAE78_06275 [Myxococcus sp.]|nr:hypothetical protein [Myxococcus sp.]